MFNGFNRDEMYDLRTDPHELTNLADRPEYADRAAELMAAIWRKIEESGDRSLPNSHYPPLRVAPVGPEYPGGRG